jgi:cephalosporin hydroxylase
MKEFDSEVLVKEAFSACGMIQSGKEAAAFAEFIKGKGIQHLLELGTNSGGMMYLLDRACEAGLRISMDRPWSSRDPDVKEREAGFHKHLPHVIEIFGDIHAQEQLEKLKTLLDGMLLDMVLVDADHSYEGGKKHYEMYAPLIRIGGFMAWHDVANGWSVGKFYDELCSRYPHQEFVDRENKYGIGILQL